MILGIDSNIGISQPEILYRGSTKNRSMPAFRNTPSPAKNLYQCCSEKRCNKEKKPGSSASRAWQPLTLNALAQYTHSIPAPGAGDFKSGAVNMWKPKIAADMKD